MKIYLTSIHFNIKTWHIYHVNKSQRPTLKRWWGKQVYSCILLMVSTDPTLLEKTWHYIIRIVKVLPFEPAVLRLGVYCQDIMW